MGFANYLARLGHYYAENDFMSLEQLAAHFSLEHISTSPAKHDIAHLRHWQREAMMRCSLAEIVGLINPYLSNSIAADKLDAFAELARDNILMPNDVTIWVDAVSANTLKFSDADLHVLRNAGDKFFTAAIEALKNYPNISFKELADSIKESTGCKGKELFMPLRIALTGQKYGPELAK